MNKTSNVFVICTEYQQIQYFFHNQVKILSEFGTVYVICPNRHDGKEFSAGLDFSGNVKHISMNIGRRPSLLKDFVNLIRIMWCVFKLKPILVQTLMPKSGLMGMLSSWMLGVENRIHIYTGQVWSSRVGIRRWFLRLCDELTAFLCTDALSDSNGQRKFLLENGIIRADRIRVLGSGSIAGVDVKRFNIDRRHRDWSKTESKNLRCIFIGRLTREKGIQNVINVFERILSEKHLIELIILGRDEGGFREEIERLKRSYDGVEYLGQRDDPEYWIGESDILLLPSYREGFGGVAIEAGAMGVPCIASNIYGLVDSVIDGYTGLKTAVADDDDLYSAIMKLYEDKDLYSVLSKNAHAYVVEHFDSLRVADEWRAFYIDILAIR